ncbi:Tpr-related protein family member, putative [Theileria annulata]|uniref:Tpr-related protein family member, putative n=1 Tax=Theileria annulata TaxID=5874 RepID=Q4U9K7_THEAN|nr:Tpr-related protein family member, putative [Theileria annulata]CAI76496.1 Tpr-related protein family member, putative [Theileria annulata]|eukprot:XP_953121.1 Tpr-related protein family member, putative [Theileria annulata]
MGAPQEDNDVRQTLKIVTYIFAGLSMMLNIRLCYSAAPYALLRFKLPENLFSIFVRKMASALELWCLPSMFLGNFIDLLDKHADGGHTLRQYTDAPKYDVTGTSLGEGLRLKATELEIASKALQTACGTEGALSGLAGQAETLATEAGNLATGTNAKSDANTVIDNFKALEDAYDGLGTTNKENQDKVKSEFGTVKHIYSRMLNVNKVKLLKSQASSMLTDASTLHTHANLLEGAALGTSALDPEALKQKAGTNQTTPGTLRFLAKELYSAASQLATKVNTGNPGYNEALNLYSAVGIGEAGKPGPLRHALAQLAGTSAANPADLNAPAQAVTTAYDGGATSVKQRFAEVETKNKSNAYANHESKYQAVVKAWTAFNNVYSADLKQLATNLAKAVGADQNSGIRKALSDLNGAQESDPKNLITTAKEVIDKYNTVKDAYNKVKELGATYTNISETKSHYGQVESKFSELQTKFNQVKSVNSIKDITLIYDKPVIRWSSIFWNWCNFFTFVILFFVFITGGDQGHVTIFYWVIAASGFVFGIYMVFVYAMEWWFLNWYMVGENSFPVVTSFMHYVSILIFGNRRKWNTDYIAVIVDMVISMCIAFIAAVLWTYCYYEPPPFEYNAPSTIEPAIVSPVIMVLVGMGIVYAIYPAIAPGMIVPFYLIDKIEMVLLIMTCFPPVIVAIVCRQKYSYSPKAPWKNPSVFWDPNADNMFWHTFIFIPPLQICLTVVFLYSLHYRDSSIARSIINQPKMSTLLSILFYMCHEIQLALGFPGMVGNNGGDQVMLPVQYVGALLMVFLAFYSEGYITEYKRHDPSLWPTEGMTKWNVFCYWYYLVFLSLFLLL